MILVEAVGFQMGFALNEKVKNAKTLSIVPFRDLCPGSEWLWAKSTPHSHTHTANSDTYATDSNTSSTYRHRVRCWLRFHHHPGRH